MRVFLCVYIYYYVCTYLYIYIYIYMLGKFLPHLTLVFVVCQSLVFPAAAKRFSSPLNWLRAFSPEVAPCSC